MYKLKHVLMYLSTNDIQAKKFETNATKMEISGEIHSL